MRGRAYRRDRLHRMKRRARTFYGGWMKNLDARHIGIAARTPKQCSRYCCGNPRTHFGTLTRQEMRHDDRERTDT